MMGTVTTRLVQAAAVTSFALLILQQSRGTTTLHDVALRPASDDSSSINSSPLSLERRRLNSPVLSSQVVASNSNQTGAIIHLGKCGGVSMLHTIGRRPNVNAIVDNFPSHYHIQPPDVLLHHSWLALVRDPIERIQSAYNYEHPQNAHLRRDKASSNPAYLKLKYQLYDCYPTLNDLVTVGLTTPSQSVNDCPMLARRILQDSNPRGLVGMIHFRMNFEAYYTKLLEHHHQQLQRQAVDGTTATKIYVVRTEHMVDDLNHVNALVGGTNHAFAKNKMKRHAHFTATDLPVSDRSLSPEGLDNLCRILCPEIQIYKQLFHASLNIDNVVYAETSGAQLAAKCPEQEQTAECPSL